MQKTMNWLTKPLILSLFCGVMSAQSTIHLDVVAQDAAGHPLKGLTQPNFTVLDNGGSVQIKSFAASSTDSSATSVMLVLDLVNAGTIFATRERDDLAKYLRRNDGKLAHPTELTVFTETGATTTNSPTTDGNQLADALSKIVIGNSLSAKLAGDAASQQRFNISIKALEQSLSAASQMSGHKLVIWLSPGWPLMSGGNMHAAPEQEDALMKTVINYSTLMRQQRITLYDLNMASAGSSPASLLRYQIYVKPINSPDKADFADLSLQVLATQTGGLVLNSNDLAPMLDRTMLDADNFYEVTLDAGTPNKKMPFHAVDVRVNQTGATTRTRNGYYVQ